MRRDVLMRSVQRLIPDDVQLIDVVIMWRRSSAVLIWMAVAGVAVGLLTTAVSYGTLSTRAGFAFAAAVLVAVVTTDNRVLAHTTGDPLLLRAGRVRQVAVELIGPVAADAEIEVVSSNLVLTEWTIDGERYSVPRRSQAAMTRLVGERSE